MTVNALGASPVTGGDLPFKNVGLVAMVAGDAVRFDTSGNANHGVIKALAAGAVTAPAGICLTSIAVGAYGLVRVYGTAIGVAEGAITVGQAVQIGNTTAKLGSVKVCGAATSQLGIAITSAAADGDLVEVLLDRAVNA